MCTMAGPDADELSKMFKAMGAKPKTKDPAEIQEWMLQYLTSVGKIPSPGGRDERQDPVERVENVLTQSPRVAIFSGESGKNDTSYEVWKYQVTCLLDKKDKYPRHVISQAIRWSLKGEAAKVAMRLGSDAEVDELLHKFDSVYGVVETKESMLAQFYSARQRDDEDVSSWSCRLEDLLNKTFQTDPAAVGRYGQNEMLRTMLWTGLKPALKDKSGHKFDAIEDFDALRSALRRVEYDHTQRNDDSHSKKTATSKMAVQNSDTLGKDISELKGIVQQMQGDLSSLKQPSGSKSQSVAAGSGNGKNRWGNRRGNRNDGRNADQYDPRQQSYQPPSLTYQPQPPSADNPHVDDNPPYVPTCYRCGQLGHLQIGCRVILDHSRILNSKGPMGRGRP